MRARLVSRRTATINQIRAFLIEQGITVRSGLRALKNSFEAILDQRREEISPRMRGILMGLYGDWLWLDRRIEDVLTGRVLSARDDETFRAHLRGCEACRATYDRGLAVLRLARGGHGQYVVAHKVANARARFDQTPRLQHAQHLQRRAMAHVVLTTNIAHRRHAGARAQGVLRNRLLKMGGNALVQKIIAINRRLGHYRRTGFDQGHGGLSGCGGNGIYSCIVSG